MSAPRLAGGRDLWTCNECGSVSEWTDAHRWYGSLKQLDDGRKVHVVCSPKCQAASMRKGRINDPGFREVA